MSSDSFPRERYAHLTDSQFRTLGRMVGVFGETLVQELLTLDTSLHAKRIDAFRAHEDAVGADASGKLEVAAQMELDKLQSKLVREHEAIVGHMRASHAAELQAAKEDRPKPIKLDVSLFEGRDGENIDRWFLEVEVAMKAALIREPSLQVAFGMSFLKKKSVVHEWAYTTLLENQGVFLTWRAFKEKLFAFHQGKHMAHNHRARFLGCKQEKRSVFEYVQVLRQLSASVASMDEMTKVTVLMEGLNIGPVRTQLFRINPPTFAEACQIALEEDNSVTRSVSKKPHAPLVASGDTSTPMDISLVDMSNTRCYNCNLRGHLSRDCRKPRRERQASSSGGQRPHFARSASRGRGRPTSSKLGNGAARN